jgi:hypothetical protein
VSDEATIWVKRPGESNLYQVSFANQLAAGESISTATVTSTPAGDVSNPGLTIGAPVIATPWVQVRLSVGTDGYTYAVNFTVTTSLGNTLHDCQPCRVRDC